MNRPLTLGAVIILLGALAPGLLVLRVGNGFGEFKPVRNATPIRIFVEAVPVVGGCLSVPLPFAILILGVNEQRSERRGAIQSPGFVTCVVGFVALILPLGYFALRMASADRLNRFGEFIVNFHNFFGRYADHAGAMIIGAWLALYLYGCRQVGPSWTD
jgi:hypothetical protein